MLYNYHILIIIHIIIINIYIYRCNIYLGINIKYEIVLKVFFLIKLNEILTH